MSATVHAIGAVTPERLAELQRQGIDVKTGVPIDWEAMELPEPQYGEVIVGPLTEEEGALFKAYYEASQQCEDMARTAMGEMLARVGQQIKSSDRRKDLREAIQEGDLQFGDEEQEKAYCRIQQMVAYLHAMLFFAIGERCNCHDWRVGIRSKGRIVKTKKRLTDAIGMQ